MSAFNKPEQCCSRTCLRSLIMAISSLDSCHSLPSGFSSMMFSHYLVESIPKKIRFTLREIGQAYSNGMAYVTTSFRIRGKSQRGAMKWGKLKRSFIPIVIIGGWTSRTNYANLLLYRSDRSR